MSLYFVTASASSYFEAKAPVVYLDSKAQPLKTIQLDAPDGPCDLEFWGSVDSSNAEPEAKKYLLVGRFSKADEAVSMVPPTILEGLRKFRFLKIETTHGVTPTIMFQSTFGS